jgi:hypothetical protein
MSCERVWYEGHTRSSLKVGWYYWLFPFGLVGDDNVDWNSLNVCGCVTHHDVIDCVGLASRRGYGWELPEQFRAEELVPLCGEVPVSWSGGVHDVVHPQGVPVSMCMYPFKAIVVKRPYHDLQLYLVISKGEGYGIVIWYGDSGGV